VKHHPHLATVCTGAVVAGLLLGLGGCRVFRDDEGIFVDPRDDYLDAQAGAPLIVPEDMEGTRIADTWPIPEVPAQPAAKTFPKEAPRPKIFVGRNLDAVRIQSLGSRRWIVSGDAPAQVWPQVKQFLIDSRVGIDSEDPESGVVQSVWLAVGEGEDVVRGAIREGLQESGGGDVPGDWLDRVELRIERGIREGSSEVHIDHQRRSGTSEGSAVAEVEVQLIAELADYLAAAVATGPVSMVGRDIAAQSKARIVEDDEGMPALLLNVDYERAWATVEQALKRAEIEIEQSDRDQGVYRAVLSGESRTGLFSRILSGRGDRGQVVSIHVANTPQGIRVDVRRPGDEPIDRELAEEILLTLREYAA